jgi:hypothetical protein
LKGIGFQPASVHNIQEAAGISQSLVQQNNVRKQEITDLWAQGRIERDTDKVDEAKRQLADWNAANPDSPIKIDPSAINKRVIEANMEKAKRLEKTAPKAIRKEVKSIVSPAPVE